jgi:predicted Zn-dependent protease
MDDTSEARYALQSALQEAADMIDDGRLPEAMSLLRDLEADHPDDAMLLCTLGAVAQQMELAGVAYEYFRRCLATNPADPTVLATVGDGLAALDDPDAESTLRLAALTAPSLPLARLRYGAYLAREGHLEHAITELEAARELDESLTAARVALGGAYVLANRIRAGADELAAALALEEGDSAVRVLYALSLLEADEDVEAAEELHRVSLELIEDGEVQLATALACAAQEWLDEAWAALARGEAAGERPPAHLIEEVEEALEYGAEAASEMLRSEIAPTMLRERLRLAY